MRVKCDACGKVFGNVKDYTDHIQSDHAVTFKCTTCRHTTSSREDLVEHIRFNSCDQHIPCELCSTKCRGKIGWNKHMETKHSNQRTFDANDKQKCDTQTKITDTRIDTPILLVRDQDILGAKVQLMDGTKGPETAGTKGQETAGTKGPETAGTKAPETAGTKAPETAGTKGPETAGTKGPETAGTKGPETAGTKGPETAGTKGPETAGTKGQPIDDAKMDQQIDDVVVRTKYQQYLCTEDQKGVTKSDFIVAFKSEPVFVTEDDENFLCKIAQLPEIHPKEEFVDRNDISTNNLQHIETKIDKPIAMDQKLVSEVDDDIDNPLAIPSERVVQVTRYVCEDSACDASFKCEENLKLHRVVHSRQDNTILPQCNYCGQKFHNIETWRRHLKREHPVNMFYCHVCKQFSCDKVADLKYHLWSVHNVFRSPKYVMRAKCLDCDIFFANMDLWRKHREQLHSEEAKYRCQLCPHFRASRYRDYAHHCNTFHKVVSKDKLISCIGPDCDKTFKSSTAYTSHRLEEHSFVYKCHLKCHFTTVKKEELAEHFINHRPVPLDNEMANETAASSTTVNVDKDNAKPVTIPTIAPKIPIPRKIPIPSKIPIAPKIPIPSKFSQVGFTPVCKDCKRVFAPITVALDNIGTFKMESVRFQCQNCKDTPRLDSSNQSKNFDLKIVTNEMKICDICQITFDSNQNLVQHRSLVHPWSRSPIFIAGKNAQEANQARKTVFYRCVQCKYTSEKREVLKQHASTLTCSICSEKFQCRYLWNSHLTAAHGYSFPVYEKDKPPIKKEQPLYDLNLACRSCTQRFPTVSALVKHKKQVHDGSNMTRGHLTFNENKTSQTYAKKRPSNDSGPAIKNFKLSQTENTDEAVRRKESQSYINENPEVLLTVEEKIFNQQQPVSSYQIQNSVLRDSMIDEIITGDIPDKAEEADFVDSMQTQIKIEPIDD